MSKLKILFMGTPEFSVPMLNAIYKSDHDLLGVVTAVDKPAGRGRKLNKSAVKEYAEIKQIKIFQPTNLKSDDFYKELESLNPNLIVVVAFRMLPKKVWSFPKFGTFNLHASLLPQYRGAAPINWAIINGEKETGLTTFFIDDKIDTGEIIDQVKIPIGVSDDVEDIYEKMLPVGSKLVIDTIDQIAGGTVKTSTQNSSNDLKTAPKLTKDNTRIDWSYSANSIYNKVRGLSPFPLAWSVLVNGDEEILCKISDVSYEIKPHDKRIGEILIVDKSFLVSVKDGLIKILKIKLSGKRLMKTNDLLNGFELKTGSKMK